LFCPLLLRAGFSASRRPPALSRKWLHPDRTNRPPYAELLVPRGVLGTNHGELPPEMIVCKSQTAVCRSGGDLTSRRSPRLAGPSTSAWTARWSQVLRSQNRPDLAGVAHIPVRHIQRPGGRRCAKVSRSLNCWL